MHHSAVLKDGGADGDTRLEQLPARPAADREPGGRLTQSLRHRRPEPSRRSRSCAGTWHRRLVGRKVMPHAPCLHRGRQGRRTTWTRGVCSHPNITRSPHQPGRPRGPSHRVRTDGDLGENTKSLSNLRRQWLRTDLAVACGPKQSVTSYTSDVCTCAYIYVYIHARKTHLHMYVRVYVCIYIHIYICYPPSYLPFSSPETQFDSSSSKIVIPFCLIS